WRDGGFHSIKSSHNTPAPIRKMAGRDARPANLLRPYLIPEVYEMISAGYDRHLGALQNVVPVFMQFSGLSFKKSDFSLEALHDFFCGIAGAADQHEGTLIGLFMDDKGSNFYLLFGAPKQIEKKEQQACEWALAAKRLIQTRFPQWSWKIG